MSLPLPARTLSPRTAGLRRALHRLWAQLWTAPSPESHLSRARARAALRAEYAAHLELYPVPAGRRAPPTARSGGERR